MTTYQALRISSENKNVFGSDSFLFTSRVVGLLYCTIGLTNATESVFLTYQLFLLQFSSTDVVRLLPGSVGSTVLRQLVNTRYPNAHMVQLRTVSIKTQQVYHLLRKSHLQVERGFNMKKVRKPIRVDVMIQNRQIGHTYSLERKYANKSTV